MIFLLLRHISRTSISLHHYRRINWLERICGGKWKTNFSKSRSQPLSTCPSDLWDICVVGFLKNARDKFSTHLHARLFLKNALILNIISNFYIELSAFLKANEASQRWAIIMRFFCRQKKGALMLTLSHKSPNCESNPAKGNYFRIFNGQLAT